MSIQRSQPQKTISENQFTFMLITVCISKEDCFLYSEEWLLFKATGTDLLILWTGWSFRPEKTSILYYLPAKISSELPNTVSGNDF